MTKTIKATIDARAINIVCEVQAGNVPDGYPKDAYLHGEFNRMRGMCPDGCCGGIGEAQDPTAEEIEMDRYIVRLFRRALEIC